MNAPPPSPPPQDPSAPPGMVWDPAQGRFVLSGSAHPSPAQLSQRATPAEDLIPANPHKSPAIASLLTFVAPGLGHLYVGQTAKGLAILVVGFVALVWACGLAAPVLGLDAYSMAVRLQEGKAVRRWQWFWDED